MSRIVNCRSCGSQKLTTVLDLGKTPLANSLLSNAQLNQAEPIYPLEVGFCHDCSLAQLFESVPPEQLFSNYAYFSSYSDTTLAHSKAIANRLTESRQLRAESLVIEIASNDGYLLQYYKSAGIPVLGIEPAENIAIVAKEKGIPTITDFFSRALATKLAKADRKADVIHANNVLAHVPDLNGVVSGFATLLKDNGVVVVEAPYVKDLLDLSEFDTIYHEHLCYFSLSALDHLFKRNGLTIVDVEKLSIHGGSLRIFAAKGGVSSSSVRELLDEEKSYGLDSIYAYNKFAGSVEKLKSELHAILTSLKNQGKTIAAYGASAKGSTLLNYIGIDHHTIDFVCDRSIAKQGLYMPGVHLPILPPEELLKRKPDYVVLLTWNFATEILAQQHEYLEAGGRFIIPIPTPTVIDSLNSLHEAEELHQLTTTLQKTSGGQVS